MNTSTRAIMLTLLVIFTCLSGCGPKPITVQLSPQVEIPQKKVVIFFPDGLDLQTMNALLAAGKLPNIRKFFVDGGVRVEKAVNCLPALTFPNSVSLFTGQFPGHHGIMGNQWFDRRNMFWINYITAEHYLDVNKNFKTPTIYERLRDHFTVNVQGHTFRGATQSFNNPIETGFGWFMGWYKEVDQFAGGSLDQAVQAANRAGRWPSVLTFYFPGVDQVGHLNGSDSTAYRDQIINFDDQIGRVTDALDRAGILNQSYLVLATDHGHIHARKLKSFDLKNWLRNDLALACHEGDIPRIGHEQRRAFLDAFDIMIVDGSHRRIMLHVKGKGGWDKTPTTTEVAAIVEGRGHAKPIYQLPCIEFVCTRETKDRVRVRSKTGAIAVERRLAGSLKEYRIVVTDGPPNSDALGLAECPANAAILAGDKLPEGTNVKSSWSCIAAGWLSSREWLRQTVGSRHPDFVPQIIEYFDSPCAGDILLFAAQGWVFSGNGAGEHGSCLAEDMLIPLYFAGPDLPPGKSIEYGRLVDVMPTILDLLGESDQLAHPPEIDGVSLARELRTAMTKQ